MSGREKLFTPRFAIALRALIDNAADAEAVIALVAGGVRRELFAFWANIVELALKRLMIVEQLQLAQHAHMFGSRSAASIVA
ncbi:MAG TPA: hypothetical protein VNX88_13630 [Terriglobales bacterium]|nr:hypothetical protein [Terriglobales bacterium]